jgi:hypothetical protein
LRVSIRMTRTITPAGSGFAALGLTMIGAMHCTSAHSQTQRSSVGGLGLASNFGSKASFGRFLTPGRNVCPSFMGIKICHCLCSNLLKRLEVATCCHVGVPFRPGQVVTATLAFALPIYCSTLVFVVNRISMGSTTSIVFRRW